MDRVRYNLVEISESVHSRNDRTPQVYLKYTVLLNTRWRLKPRVRCGQILSPIVRHDVRYNLYSSTGGQETASVIVIPVAIIKPAN